MMRWTIRGGRIIDPAHGIDRSGDLYVADGKIVALDQAPDGFTADRELDAGGKLVLPGLVDLCANVREPGLEHKGSIRSESAAAASAGITTICCPPDTNPVIDTPAVAELIRHRAAATGSLRILPMGALTVGLDGERLSEMAALKAAGCIGVSNTFRPVVDTQILRHALAYASTHDLTAFLCAMEPWLQGNGCVHEGVISTRLGLAGIPEIAETIAIARDLALVERTGVRAHFCRLSTAGSVELISAAQQRGLPVTADTSAHQLHLTELDIVDFDGNFHVIPPFRTQRDRDALRRGVADGTLSAVCSDHQPHEAEAKLAPLSETEPGISALETLLSLTLRLVDDGQIALPEAIARVTSGPAAVLRIDAGTLAPGCAADICIYDPDRPWRLDAARMRSAGRNTPFLGWEFSGQVTHTLLGGHAVFELDDQPS